MRRLRLAKALILIWSSLPGKQSDVPSFILMVVSVLHSGKILMYAIPFTPLIHMLVYLVPGMSVLFLSCSYIDSWTFNSSGTTASCSGGKFYVPSFAQGRIQQLQIAVIVEN